MLKNAKRERIRQPNARPKSSIDNDQLLHSIGEGICGIDRNGLTSFCNPAGLELLGYRLDEILGRNLHDLVHHSRQNHTPYPVAECPIYQVLRGDPPPLISAEVFWRKDGTTLPVEYVCTPIIEGEEAVGVVVAFRDVTRRQEQEARIAEQMELLKEYGRRLEIQQAEQVQTNARLMQTNTQLAAAIHRLEALAPTDSLTGVKNHRAFLERLDEECLRSTRYAVPLSIVLLDIDRFLEYTDTFGQLAGDDVLRQLADVLQSQARQTDIVARCGVDMFAVILTETDPQGASIAAERLRIGVEGASWKHRPITVSIGFATWKPGYGQAAGLMAAANTALCRAKKLGRNRVSAADDLDTEELQRNASKSYSDIVDEMLRIQMDTLSSTSEQVRETLAEAYDATIMSWSRLLDMRDKETEGHSERVTHLTVHLAECVGMNSEEVLYARWGALLHDVGKMGVPDSILHKPGPLTDEEWAVMRQHPAIAFNMLSSVAFLRPALDIPYCHHEKWDGTGYPRGLKGEDIPLAARLFAPIDVYDALTSDRPYRKGWSQEQTLAHLRSLSGTHFDPRAVDRFIALLTEADDAGMAEQDQLAA